MASLLPAEENGVKIGHGEPKSHPHFSRSFINKWGHRLMSSGRSRSSLLISAASTTGDMMWSAQRVFNWPKQASEGVNDGNRLSDRE
jgi:hypothetical protein